MQKALDALSARGPDGEGQWWSEDGRVGLGHRRLAINDEQGGAQPLVSPERFITCINGEFYGLDGAFRGETDSLALPEVYRSFGMLEGLRRLRGEFAFVFFDSASGRLYAGRDRFGIKPLVYARRGEELWLASKPSALWAAGVETGWCEKGFLQAAATQYPPAHGSLFRSVQSVPPGHVLEIEGALVELKRYWSLPAQAGGPVVTEEFLERLRDCVWERVRTGHLTAVMLSGGVDSASILALAAETGERLKAYTVDFPEALGTTYSEAELAREQAAYSQVKHCVIPITRQDILKGLSRAVQESQGLCVNGHLVAKWELARAIRADCAKVVLTGEGSDELLYGYRHFAPYFENRQSSSDFDPAGVGILVDSHQPKVLPDNVPHFFHTKYELGRRIGAFLVPELQADEAFASVFPTSLSPREMKPRQKARAAWLDTALRSYILEVLGDGSEMAHSVEGRPPFLDHLLWERYSEPEDGGKSLLREAVKGLVVESIRSRPKHPFMALPLGVPLLDQLTEQVAEVEHPFVSREKALIQLETLRGLPDEERLVWEPPMLWLLSSYYLQELWS